MRMSMVAHKGMLEDISGLCHMHTCLVRWSFNTDHGFRTSQSKNGNSLTQIKADQANKNNDNKVCHQDSFLASRGWATIRQMGPSGKSMSSSIIMENAGYYMTVSIWAHSLTVWCPLWVGVWKDRVAQSTTPVKQCTEEKHTAHPTRLYCKDEGKLHN